MTYGLILKSAAVVTGIFGLALVFMPNTLMALYKAEQLNSPGVYNSMLLGSAFIGLAVMDWAASNAPTIADVRYVIFGNLASDLLGFLVVLVRQMTAGGATEAGWLNVALYFVFACLFAYLQFTKLSAGRSAGASIHG